MNLSQLTREHKLFAAALGNVVFIISLFLNWFGVSGIDSKPDDVLGMWWLYLIFGVAAAVLFLAAAINFDLPPPINPIVWGTYLTSINFIVSATNFIDPPGPLEREIGLILAFIFTLVALIGAIWAWREERPGAGVRY